MSRQYLFSDESGDLAFRLDGNATRRFGVGTLLISEENLTQLRHSLTLLRDDLAWRGHGLDSYLHATDDSVEIRLEVFRALRKIDFRVDVTLAEKAKSPAEQQFDGPAFFRYVWQSHLEALAATALDEGNELMVVAADLGTKRIRKAFRGAIEAVMTDCLPFRVKRRLAFWPCASDHALQAADYCLWAVARKYEQGDDRYFEFIESKVASIQHEPPPS